MFLADCGRPWPASDSGGGAGGNTVLLTDDMLYKLSKKIAQLTKVIYSLNTKNDDLELEMEKQRQDYEEKTQYCTEKYDQSFTKLRNRRAGHDK